MNMCQYYLEDKGETKTFLLGQDFAIFDLNKVALRLIAEFIYWWTNTFLYLTLKIIIICLSLWILCPLIQSCHKVRLNLLCNTFFISTFLIQAF